MNKLHLFKNAMTALLFSLLFNAIHMNKYIFSLDKKHTLMN